MAAIALGKYSEALASFSGTWLTAELQRQPTPKTLAAHCADSGASTVFGEDAAKDSDRGPGGITRAASPPSPTSRPDSFHRHQSRP